MNNTNNLSENQLEKKILQYPRFDKFLNNMFEDIQSNKIKTLVIDVRNNTGGNSKLCDILLSWLKPIKDIREGSSSIRFSELWKLHYMNLYNEYKRIFAEIKLPFKMGTLYDSAILSSLSSIEKSPSIINKMNEYFLMNKDTSKIFKGNIIFIQGKKTYSSAGLLITEARDNNIGIIIGDKSSYRPCNYGDILFGELPNTHIKGSVSHKIFYRPNVNKCNESTLIPDVYLPTTWSDVIQNKDVCWEWVLKQ